MCQQPPAPRLGRGVQRGSLGSSEPGEARCERGPLLRAPLWARARLLGRCRAGPCAGRWLSPRQAAPCAARGSRARRQREPRVPMCTSQQGLQAPVQRAGGRAARWSARTLPLHRWVLCPGPSGPQPSAWLASRPRDHHGGSGPPPSCGAQGPGAVSLCVSPALALARVSQEDKPVPAPCPREEPAALAATRSSLPLSGEVTWRLTQTGAEMLLLLPVAGRGEMSTQC